jgi:hypothetical protein
LIYKFQDAYKQFNHESQDNTQDDATLVESEELLSSLNKKKAPEQPKDVEVIEEIIEEL